MLDPQLIEQLAGRPLYKFDGGVPELTEFMASQGISYNFFTQEYVVYVSPAQPITDVRLEQIQID